MTKAFEQYHPFVLLFYFLSVLLIAMFVANPVLQTLALGGAIAFNIALSKQAFAKSLLFYVPMFFLIAVTNPLFSHNGETELFSLFGTPITLESLLYGVSISVMIVGVMLWFACMTRIMTDDKFLYLFGKAIPKLSLILSMALRFIPLFSRQMRKVNRVRKAMGLSSDERFTDRLRSTAKVFGAMIAWSMENAMETSASMRARGYGIKGRTNFSLFRFYAKDATLLTVCVVLLGITVVGVGTGETAFSYYPRLDGLNLSVASIVIYAAFGTLSFLPFILEVKEAILWNYYRSKI